MKTLPSVLALALLTGCAAPASTRSVQWGAMGQGGAPVFVWHWVEDPNKVCRALSKEPPVGFARIKGCSVVRGRECHIYVAKPTDDASREDRYTTILHEMRHCTDGHFHDKFGREDPNRIIWR